MFRKRELTREDLGNNRTLIKGNCSFTGEEWECEVPTDGLEKWHQGLHIQLAMPEVAPEVREFLISGITPQGWKRAFG